MIKKFISGFSLIKSQVNFLFEKHGIYDLNNPRFLQGKILAELYRDKEFRDAEFQVFSQFGDDGLIQWLIQRLEIPASFIEFGVEKYTESNTRFLLINNNWRGLVIDGSREAVNFIKNDPVSLYHDLTAVNAFITKDNINGLLKDHGDAGLLSIDIDGNDYWVWKEINLKPVLVIAEYNAVFGNHPWTLPYNESFVRGANKQYWGVGLKALEILGREKGYSLIGCNKNGNNAYFVRNDKVGGLAKSFDEAYNPSVFREDFIDGERIATRDRFRRLNGCIMFNVETGKTETVVA